MSGLKDVHVQYTVGRTCSKKTACLNFLCLLPMVLKTRGLGTGATFMRGSYVAEPRLLAWLRERTVLVKSEHELHAIYRECLKLIFAFATQSSLSKVRNDNVRNAVPTRGTCRTRTAASVLHTQTCSRNSSTVPCRKTCTNNDNSLRAVTYR